MKSLIIVFGATLLIIALPFLFDAFDNAQTDEAEQSFSGVSTGAGVYSANVTLGQELYRDDHQQVSSISSNETLDSPTASAYNSVSRVLTVSGLAESESRTLTVSFLIDSTTLPTGFGTFFTLFRWFLIFTILGMMAGAIYAFFD